MSETAHQLQHALADLQRALDASPSVDPGVRQRLDRAIEEIRAALSRLPAEQEEGRDRQSSRQSSGDADESLAGQLADVARDFEASHPTLSGMVGSVVDALARMGI